MARLEVISQLMCNCTFFNTIISTKLEADNSILWLFGLSEFSTDVFHEFSIVNLMILGRILLLVFEEKDCGVMVLDFCC